MKNRHFDLSGAGSMSLLISMTLVVLALLSMISLGRARAERRTADSAEKAIAEYYAADMEAEKILAMLRNNLPVEGVAEEDGIYYYQCSISEHKALMVEVKKDTGEVLRWEVEDQEPQ